MNKQAWFLSLIIFYACLLQGFSQIFFTPRDNIRAQLISMIQAERKSIHAAMYMLTDKTIAQALIDAYVRGVKVWLVLDHVSMGERYGKGVFLENNGITIFVHKPKDMSAFTMPIMHHKFFIFGFNDLFKKSVVWTGSFNGTASAATIHDENVIMTDDATAVQEYQKCFIALINRINQVKSLPYDLDIFI